MPHPSSSTRVLSPRSRLLACPITLALAMCLFAGCRAGAPRGEPLLTDAQRQLNLESFEYVWKTVRDNHYDPDMGGLDWQAVHDELHPRIEQAATASAARGVLSDMVGRLHLSHYAIFPASVYEDVNESRKKADTDRNKDSDDADDKSDDDEDSTSRNATPGIDLRVIDGQAVVVSIEPDQPAAQAGVTPGWIIEEIDGEKIAPMLARLHDAFSDSPWRGLIYTRAVLSRMRGKTDDEARIVFRDGDDRETSKKLSFVEPAGRPAKFGNLPTHYVWLRHRWIEHIGYIRLNIFLDPMYVAQEFEKAMREYSDADGMIVDLRGNLGGLGGMAMGLAGWFIRDRQQQLGTMITRQAQLKFAINPRPAAFEGPLAILTDELTASTSEILAGGLQDLGRARVFGRTTPGAAQPSRIERLPNGDGFQYVFANYVSAGGQQLEGKGVVPDVPVELTRAALLDGIDPDIEAARAWIRERVVK